ncbi:hypothetical protein CMUS01_13553 [Colletotrichum musicola]|uniref:Uncharacterized protein n=1 Tax=Colletotrichum musicola TaxID=2175873 RepID=A0A8H6JBL4_9PEZI|nr:hypothetical protein CMUS01_13553 [Colletotrichum musicola]
MSRAGHRKVNLINNTGSDGVLVARCDEATLHLELVATVRLASVTPDVREDVLNQLDTTISIYGADGVFAEFESEFKVMLGKPGWFSLLHNSKRLSVAEKAASS